MQSHLTTPSSSKTPNKYDSTESNEEKISTGSKNQTTRAEGRIAGNFPNSHKKYKLTNRKRSG